MIKIGEYQTLTIAREMPQGYYLEDEDGEEVLFPQKYITDGMEIDDRIKVFVYCDSSDREVATTEKPLLLVNETALLEVVHTNELGAFCEWGVLKNLFVPFSNQQRRMAVGEKHVVHMYLDEVTDRLVGTTKIEGYLDLDEEEDISMGKQVTCLVFQITDIGYKVVVDQSLSGMIYKNEAPPLEIGQVVTGYLKPLRPDGKLDVSINPIGYQNIDPQAERILKKLEQNKGFLPFTDKSAPEDIRTTFGISKKLFKKAIGSLYKQKVIVLKSDGIYKV